MRVDDHREKQLDPPPPPPPPPHIDQSDPGIGQAMQRLPEMMRGVVDTVFGTEPAEAKGGAPQSTEQATQPTDGVTVPTLADPDRAQKAIADVNDRVVVGVSFKGSLLNEGVDKALDVAVTEIVEKVMDAKFGRNPVNDAFDRPRDEIVEDVVNQVQNTKAYKKQRADLLKGATDMDTMLADWSKKLDVDGAPSAANPATSFDPTDMVGLEIWAAPLNEKALAHFGDGDGNLVTDLAAYTTDAIGNGFVNVKVFTDELAKVPGLKGKNTQIAAATTVATFAATAFGGKEAGVETGTLAKEFLGTFGTLFSGDTARGNNFQVGMPINALSSDGEINALNGKPVVDEIWLTALNYNVPVLPSQDAPVYLGYSDLRRVVLKPDEDGQWDHAGFVIADRAIELGVNFSPSDADTTGSWAAHVGTIGRFSAYMSKDSVADGTVRQLEDGTLGYLAKKDGTDYFRPFGEQERTMFDNVFLSGEDAISLDDVRTLAEGEYTLLTDDLLAKEAKLPPLAEKVVELSTNPVAQDLWSAGVSMIPAIATGNPVAIGAGTLNATIDISQNRANRDYADILKDYTVTEGPHAGRVDPDAFVEGELAEFSADWQQVRENYAAFAQSDAFDGQSIKEFIDLATKPTSGIARDYDADPETDPHQLIVRSANTIFLMEDKAERMQGNITRLLREGEVDAVDLHAALEKQTGNGSTAPTGDFTLYASVADRMLGGHEPIVVADTQDGRIRTNQDANIRANAWKMFTDTSRPAALEILNETNGLTDLSEFKTLDLYRIEDTATLSEFTGILRRDHDYDVTDLYRVADARASGDTSVVLRDNPELLTPHVIFGAIEREIAPPEGHQIPGNHVIERLGELGLDKLSYAPGWDNLDFSAVDDVPEMLSSYRSAMAEEGPDGMRRYDAFVEEIALGLIEVGSGDIPAGSTHPDLAETLERFTTIRDSGVADDRLTSAFGITDAVANRIIDGRNADPVDVGALYPRQH